MLSNNDQPNIKNVDLMKDAPRLNAVTGFNMHYALPLGIVLLFGLYVAGQFLAN